MRLPADLYKDHPPNLVIFVSGFGKVIQGLAQGRVDDQTAHIDGVLHHAAIILLSRIGAGGSDVIDSQCP